MAAKREQTGITGDDQIGFEATAVSLQCFQTPLNWSPLRPTRRVLARSAGIYSNMPAVAPRCARPERSARGREIAQAEFAHDRTGIERAQVSVPPHEAVANASFFLTPAHNTGLTWGAGPALLFPTAISNELGTDKWSAGPTGALVYSRSEIPWFAGLLVTQLWSFAGAPRTAVNQTSTEVDLSYNFESGWYIQTDPTHL